MDSLLLKTVERMRKCSAIVEAELKAVLELADRMGEGAGRPVAEVLVRLVESAADVPLRVADFVEDAQAMRVSVDVLAQLLRDVEPERLCQDVHVRRAMRTAGEAVRKGGLPEECVFEYQTFVFEVASAVRSLQALAPEGKRRSPERLLHAVRKFFRKAWYAVACLSFNSLKLLACARACAELTSEKDDAFDLLPRRVRRLRRNVSKLRSEAPRAWAAMGDAYRQFNDEVSGFLRERPGALSDRRRDRDDEKPLLVDSTP